MIKAHASRRWQIHNHLPMPGISPFRNQPERATMYYAPHGSHKGASHLTGHHLFIEITYKLREEGWFLDNEHKVNPWDENPIWNPTLNPCSTNFYKISIWMMKSMMGQCTWWQADWWWTGHTGLGMGEDSEGDGGWPRWWRSSKYTYLPDRIPISQCHLAEMSKNRICKKVERDVNTVNIRTNRACITLSQCCPQ